MAFTAKILSWRFRHLNIAGCLLKRRPTKGGSRAPQDLPLATPLDNVKTKPRLAEVAAHHGGIMQFLSLTLSWVNSKRSSHYHASGICRHICQQGHPATVFCKISVRRSKYCLEFSITRGRLKISRWLFHSCTIFEAYLINSLRFSSLIFHILLPRLGYFS